MGAMEEAKGEVIKPVAVVVEADMCPKEVEVQQMSGVAEVAVESEVAEEGGHNLEEGEVADDALLHESDFG